MSSSDWYYKAKKKLLLELWLATETTPEDAEKIYAHLCKRGLIDYDSEKEFLRDEYGEEGEEEDE